MLLISNITIKAGRLNRTDKRITSLISDYKIHMVIPQELDDFNKFRTTLGEVLEIIKVSEDKAAMKQLLATNPQFAAMDNESVSAINTFIGVNIPVNTEGSVTDMCKAWEDQKEEGRTEGRKEGRTEGRREMIKHMLSSGKTPEEIAAFASISLEEVQEVEHSMLANV